MTDVADRRTYGMWVKPRSPGLPGFGLIGTVLVFAALVVGAGLALILGWLAGLVWVLFAGPLLVPLVYKTPAGRTGWEALGTRVAWWRLRRNATRFLGGGLGELLGSTRLPGLLTTAKLYSATSADGFPFALIHVPQTATYTVMLSVEPDGGALVDRDVVDVRVASYGEALADLAHEPDLDAVSVTVDTAADDGAVLATEIGRLLGDSNLNIPPLADQVFAEVADSYPTGSAAVTGHVALTYRARHGRGRAREPFTGRVNRRRLRSAEDMAAVVGSRLAGLTELLEGCGLGAPRPMTATEISEYVRIAYDPQAAQTVAEARAAGSPSDMTWADAGPTGAQETWGGYRHDSAFSVTWEMVRPPRGAVESNVLEDLLSPTDIVTRKRVTMLYRLIDPAQSADIAHSGVRTAITRATGRRGEVRADLSAEVDAARQTAAEEAQGAGMVCFSLLATATVTDVDAVAEAMGTIDHLGRSSRLKLRPVYGGQAAAFQAALGVGIIPRRYSPIPARVKDML